MSILLFLLYLCFTKEKAHVNLVIFTYYYTVVYNGKRKCSCRHSTVAQRFFHTNLLVLQCLQSKAKQNYFLLVHHLAARFRSSQARECFERSQKRNACHFHSRSIFYARLLAATVCVQHCELQAGKFSGIFKQLHSRKKRTIANIWNTGTFRNTLDCQDCARRH